MLRYGSQLNSSGCSAARRGGTKGGREGKKKGVGRNEWNRDLQFLLFVFVSSFVFLSLSSLSIRINTVIEASSAPGEGDADAANSKNYFVHSICFMHMLWTVIMNMLQPLDLINPVYCGCLVIRRFRVLREMKQFVKEYVHRETTCVQTAPPNFEEARRLNASIVELMEAVDRQVFSNSSMGWGQASPGPCGLPWALMGRALMPPH